MEQNIHRPNAEAQKLPKLQFSIPAPQSKAEGATIAEVVIVRLNRPHAEVANVTVAIAEAAILYRLHIPNAEAAIAEVAIFNAEID